MADSKKKTKLTVGDIVSSDVTLANLEDIKHRFYEIGKKEGKVSLADIEKACSTLDLSESEFDELYRFFADNNIAIDEYKESGLSDESEILENSMLDNCSESDEEDDFDEEEAFPESGDVDVKVINKSEKEAVSEETVKSEDGFKPADNADTTEDNTETINLEEVK